MMSFSSNLFNGLKRTLCDPFESKMVRIDKLNAYGITPRNAEQSFALHMLLDNRIKMVTLSGKAGTGKTLLALAAAMERRTDYRQILLARPIVPLSNRDIGFLPGTMEEKMRPWLMPIQDNLEYLMSDKTGFDMYIEQGVVEIEALTYIRGRSIANAFIIIDEAQNLTNHELKTIITRVGEGTKIVLTGDVEQIDSQYLDSTTNGLSYAIEKFKKYDLAGHMTLTKGERSKVATLAAKIL